MRSVVASHGPGSNPRGPNKTLEEFSRHGIAGGAGAAGGRHHEITRAARAHAAATSAALHRHRAHSDACKVQQRSASMAQSCGTIARLCAASRATSAGPARSQRAHHRATSAQQASTSSVPTSGHGAQQRAERRYNGWRKIARPARSCRASIAQHRATFCVKLPQLRPALRIQHVKSEPVEGFGVQLREQCDIVLTYEQEPRYDVVLYELEISRWFVVSAG
ncbi:Kinase-like protein [Dorcoceras hygrometricum]|uniref:Kinase-like protein n=1 Tax=Dorcoceras hygrometricum TaxID=472368 RepID=A0A2Z7CNF2_9LAMI|nr:Kinase-like protein [Dorcoceras hygrometricum]